jgi:hypothetical protein
MVRGIGSPIRNVSIMSSTHAPISSRRKLQPTFLFNWHSLIFHTDVTLSRFSSGAIYLIIPAQLLSTLSSMIFCPPLALAKRHIGI